MLDIEKPAKPAAIPLLIPSVGLRWTSFAADEQNDTPTSHHDSLMLLLAGQADPILPHTDISENVKHDQIIM